MKKHCLGLVIVFFAILVIGGALELMLRAFFPLHLTGHREACQYDGELGFRWQENIHVLKTTDHQQEIYTNPLGTVNFQADLSDYQVLVFAAGDSFTQGTGLPVDAAYPSQLDLLLNMQDSRYVKKFAVVNLGIAVYGGKQNLLALQRYAERLGKPRYILYLGCANDYVDDLLFAEGHAHAYMVAGNPRWPWYTHPLVWWAHETEVGKRTKMALGNLKRQRLFARDQGMGQLQEKGRGAAELEEPVFQELVRTSGDWGAKLIISWAGLPSEPDGSYGWLQEFARKHNVAFADWHPAVASVQAAIPAMPLTNPHSGGHYRTWVNGLIARAYAQHMEPPERSAEGQSSQANQRQ